LEVLATPTYLIWLEISALRLGGGSFISDEVKASRSFTPLLETRRFENQKTEIRIAASALNNMTALGRPEFEAVRFLFIGMAGVLALARFLHHGHQ